VLSFGPGERFFPTIPFFSAFDGEGRDFRDPWEVAPYLKDRDSAYVSWNDLLALYHPAPPVPADSARAPDHGTMEFALKRVVVLYRICSLSADQSGKIVRFLRSDEQAFERFEDVKPLYATLGLDPKSAKQEAKARGTKPDPSLVEPQFDVIQYFLYYLADKGLLGHPNDIELVSVFLPRNRALWDRFRIVVGSGHTSRTPNNVLVLSSFHRGEPTLDTTFVMVELGGHSSAPDHRPYGKFTPGLDANWHAYDVWGTRDAQAASGVGYLGRYEQAMTFDRDRGTVGTYVYPPTYDSTQMRRSTLAIQGPPDTTTRNGQDHTEPIDHRYRLLPMHLLFQLDSVLEDTAAVQAISAAVSAIQRRLCPPIDPEFRPAPGAKPECEGPDPETWSSEDFSTLDTVAQRNAITAMMRWKGEMIVDRTYNRFEPRNQALPGLPRAVEELEATPREKHPAGKHRPWDHQSFKGVCKGGNCVPDPTEVFKTHLFRPNTYTVGFEDLILLGANAAATDGYEVYTGLVIPAFRNHGFPIRTGGFMELQIGANKSFHRNGDVSPTFRLLHQGHRNSLVSWYVSGSWVPRRPHVVRDPDAGEFSISGGGSLLPVLLTKINGFPNVLRLRGGLRLDPFQGGNLLNRARWELNLAFRQ
jgi:hypothetical protein